MPKNNDPGRYAVIDHKKAAWGFAILFVIIVIVAVSVATCVN